VGAGEFVVATGLAEADRKLGKDSSAKDLRLEIGVAGVLPLVEGNGTGAAGKGVAAGELVRLVLIAGLRGTAGRDKSTISEGEGARKNESRDPIIAALTFSASRASSSSSASMDGRPCSDIGSSEASDWEVNDSEDDSGGTPRAKCGLAERVEEVDCGSKADIKEALSSPNDTGDTGFMGGRSTRSVVTCAVRCSP